MPKGLQRSLSRGPKNTEGVIKTNIAKTLALPVTGGPGIGRASAAVDGLPEGNLSILGLVAMVQVTGVSANITDTWNGDFSFGTTAADDSTLTGDDVNILASTALGPAVAKVSPLVRNEVTHFVLDNTAGNATIYFNLLVDDLDISGDDPDATVYVEFYMAYTILGDD